MKRLNSRVKVLGSLLILAIFTMASCSNSLVSGASEETETTALQARAVAGGFRVSAGKLLDANGNQFVMRGINHANAWYPDKLDSAVNGIAGTGANTIRVVLSNGVLWSKTSASQVGSIITAAKAKNLVTVLEVHDTTGYNEQSGASSLDQAVNYWKEIKSVLIGQEAYVIINIGNEPFGNNQSTGDAWVNGHKTAITALRQAGLNHVLMIDAPNWGQDWQNFMRDRSGEILGHDANVMFSVHMYEVYQDWNKIDSYVSAFTNNNRCLVIGEFGADHKGQNVDEASIMSVAKARNIGYMGWSWSGNGSEFASLDIVNSWNAASQTGWGTILINSSNGIRATSKPATIFTGGTGGGSTGTVIKYDFEGSTQGWSGLNHAGGPWSSTEWKATGSSSLKVNVTMGAGKAIRLVRTANDNFSGKSSLKATVRHAAWGSMGSGMKARLYIKTGSAWTWKDSGWIAINSVSDTVLTVSLTGVNTLADVREIGVEYLCASNASGSSALYMDYVRME